MSTSRDEELAAWIIALLSLKGVGTKMVANLLRDGWTLIQAADSYDAEFVETLEAAGVAKANRIAKALRSDDGGSVTQTWEERVAEAYETLETASEQRIHVLQPFSSAYPRRLLRNQGFPPILYCKGDLATISSERAVAIIGTREPTSFGSKMGRRLSQVLAEDGYAIVSGLALGCDTVGHQGALDVGGRTVAVLPTPIDSPVYPKQNQNLADSIVEEGGALVSEYAPGTRLSSRQLISNLVARDEWQPALSDGVVAIETSVNGGTRHAINHALKTGTPVAVFDYRGSKKLRTAFESDPRFGGNMKYLTSDHNVSSIYGPETIEAFKARMDTFRRGHSDEERTGSSEGSIKEDGQQRLPID